MSGPHPFSLLLNAHYEYPAPPANGAYSHIRLYETARDSYLQIIQTFRNIAENEGRIGISMSVSPPLLTLLSDGSFRSGFGHFMDNTVKSLTSDLRYFAESGNREKLRVAEYWLKKYDELTFLFNDIGGDITAELARLEGRGLELLTTAATNPPLYMLGNEKCIKAQIMVGARAFEEHVGHAPGGMWIPGTLQRGDRNGSEHIAGVKSPWKTIDDAVASAGLSYFITDAGSNSVGGENGEADVLRPVLSDTGHEQHSPHVLKGGHGTFAALTGTVASAAGWHRCDGGYATDADYLESDAKSVPGGIRYWHRARDGTSVEGRETYSPEAAASRVEEHASDFLEEVIEKSSSCDGAIVTVAADAELFGGMWHEGPDWISRVFGKMNGYGILAKTAGECVRETASAETVSLSNLLCRFEFNQNSEWKESAGSLLKSIHGYETRYIALLHNMDSKKYGGTKERVAKQAGRELLLLEGSARIPGTSSGTKAEDAEHEPAHSGCFDRLMEIASKNDTDEEDRKLLENCEKMHPIFPRLDISAWE